MSLEEEILTLKAHLSNLPEGVFQLEVENTVLRLEEIVLKNQNLERRTKLSENSNKPGYDKKLVQHNIIPNKVGSQIDRQGKTLEMSSTPDESVKHYAQRYTVCSNRLSESEAIKIGSSNQVYKNFGLRNINF